VKVSKVTSVKEKAGTGENDLKLTQRSVTQQRVKKVVKSKEKKRGWRAGDRKGEKGPKKHS